MYTMRDTDDTRLRDRESSGGRIDRPDDESGAQRTRDEPGPGPVSGAAEPARPASTTGVLRRRQVPAGDWRTLEHFWNARGTAFFRRPADAEIKVRYGIGWFGFDTQEQTLNGADYKKLEVGRGSIARARMQMKVPETTTVTYEVHGGGVAVTTPEHEF